MRKEKTAAFLADCLAHMPAQPKQVQSAVDAVIAGLTRIADGGQWTRGEALSAYWAADWAAWARAAAYAAARAAYWAGEWSANLAADWAAARAADWAARAHPDPDKERARQAQKRKELGL